MGMGMIRWEWEGNGNKKAIPAHLYYKPRTVPNNTCVTVHDMLQERKSQRLKPATDFDGHISAQLSKGRFTNITQRLNRLTLNF